MGADENEVGVLFPLAPSPVGANPHWYVPATAQSHVAAEIGWGAPREGFSEAPFAGEAIAETGATCPASPCACTPSPPVIPWQPCSEGNGNHVLRVAEETRRLPGAKQLSQGNPGTY